MAWGAAPTRKASPAVPAPVNLYQQQLGWHLRRHVAPLQVVCLIVLLTEAVCALAAAAAAGPGTVPGSSWMHVASCARWLPIFDQEQHRRDLERQKREEEELKQELQQQLLQQFGSQMRRGTVQAALEVRTARGRRKRRRRLRRLGRPRSAAPQRRQRQNVRRWRRLWRPRRKRKEENGSGRRQRERVGSWDDNVLKRDNARKLRKEQSHPCLIDRPCCSLSASDASRIFQHGRQAERQRILQMWQQDRGLG